MPIVNSDRRPLIICLPVQPGEETAAQASLRTARLRTTQPHELVLLAWPGVEWRETGVSVQTLSPAATRHPLQCVLECMTWHFAQHDVLVLWPGAIPPQAWDARLRMAAYSQPQIGIAGPLSAAADDTFRTIRAGIADDTQLDRWLFALGQRRNVEVPQILGPCFYLRQEALQAVCAEIESYAGSAADFPLFLARQLRWHGFCNVVADHLWVGELPSSCASAPTQHLRFDAPHAQSARPHYLQVLGEALGQSLSAGSAPPEIPGVDDPPVQLHIMHGWGGGLGHWVEDYCRADTQRSNMTLRPTGNIHTFGQSLALYRHVDDADPVQRWTLDPPIQHTAIAHLQYQEILRDIVASYGVGAIMVSSLIGHSLDALRTELPTLIVNHDYYPYCAALNIRFDGVCESCDQQRLERCFAENPYNQLMRASGAEYWAALRAQYLELVLRRQIPRAAPSASVPRQLHKVEPRLANTPCRVVPHGIDPPQPFVPTPPPPREKPRAVILGRITPEKGADLLWQILPQVTELIDLVLVGSGEKGERFAGKRGVTLIPSYDLPELPRILAELAPDFGLLLSVLPETFSYTLSEMLCAGIPPVATRLGSFAERIEDGVTGFLIEPTSVALLDMIRALCADASRLAAVRQRLCGYRHRTRAEMVADYQVLLPISGFSAERYARGLPPPAPTQDSAAPETAAAACQSPAHAAPPQGGLWERLVAEESFGCILARMYQLTRSKLMSSPRLRAWQRPLADFMVRGSWQIVKLGKRLLRRRAA